MMNIFVILISVGGATRLWIEDRRDYFMIAKNDEYLCYLISVGEATRLWIEDRRDYFMIAKNDEYLCYPHLSRRGD
jgi:hypothetical protein